MEGVYEVLVGRVPMSAAEAPIMIRATLTRDEWTELRKVALDSNASTAELVARALRQTYPAIVATNESA